MKLSWPLKCFGIIFILSTLIHVAYPIVEANSPPWPQAGSRYYKHSMEWLYGPWMCDDHRYLDARTPVHNDQEWQACLQNDHVSIRTDFRHAMETKLEYMAILIIPVNIILMVLLPMLYLQKRHGSAKYAAFIKSPYGHVFILGLPPLIMGLYHAYKIFGLMGA